MNGQMKALCQDEREERSKNHHKDFTAEKKTSPKLQLRAK